MPAKNKPNAFLMYMQELQAKMRKDGRGGLSMREMPAIARPTWNQMTPEQRRPYEMKAKEYKQQQQQQPNNDFRRKDNQRQYIADRRDPVRETERKRAAEKRKMISEWKERDDLLDLVFHVINFQVQFSDDNLEYRLPVEIGMVRISLRHGIMGEMHRIIDPGDCPEGYRSKAIDHCETYHNIPLNYQEGDKNYRSLWQQIEEFVLQDMEEGGDVPPLFCLSDECPDVEMCMEFLYTNSHVSQPNQLTKIYSLDDLVISLLVCNDPSPNPPEASKTQVRDKLMNNTWDYCSNIRCVYHEEKDCRYCSISIVKRYSFAMFDGIATTMGFKLTKNHMNDGTSTDNMVFRLASFNINSLNREEERSESYNRRRDPPSGHMSSMPVGRGRGSRATSPPALFKGPRPDSMLNRPVEVRLSDDELPYNSDDDDDVLHTDEVKSTVDQYRLKELRLPKSISMAASGGQTTVDGGGQGSDSDEHAAATPAGPPLVAAPPLGRGAVRAPMGRGVPAVPLGRGLTTAAPPMMGGRGRGMMRPPPGFGAPSAAVPAPAAGMWGQQAPSPWGAISTPAPLAAWGSPAGAARVVPAGMESLANRSAPPSLTPNVPRGRGVMVGRGFAPPEHSAVPVPGRGRGVPMGRGFASVQ